MPWVSERKVPESAVFLFGRQFLDSQDVYKKVTKFRAERNEKQGKNQHNLQKAKNPQKTVDEGKYFVII